MSVGVRHLTVLGEFKPFGLIAEALDGKPTETVQDKYDYFLFDPEIARERDETDDYGELESPLSDRSDHELFIRGNRIIWTTGSRVYKRFTLSSSVIKACWCRLNDTSEAFLCVLQIDTLTIYNVSGEVVSIPLPRTVTSIWPLPSGLLLQQAAVSKSSTYVPFSSSSSLLNTRDISRSKRELGQSPVNSISLLNTFDHIIKGDGGSMSSHLILKDSLKEPQSIYIQERGKWNIMKEFDEKTIWTSDQIPLMASYNEGKMQHSLWVVELVNSEVAIAHLSDMVPVGVLSKQFSFRRIWQGKGAHTAAMKMDAYALAHEDVHWNDYKLRSYGIGFYSSIQVSNVYHLQAEAVIDFLLDEVIVAASEHCLDVIPLENQPTSVPPLREWIMSWKSNSSQVRCLGGTSLGAFLPPSLASLRHMKIIVVGFRMLQMSHLKWSNVFFCRHVWTD